MSRQDPLPLDRVHLDRYTGGNRALNEEILRLFDTQCRELVARIEELASGAPDDKDWRHTVHTLKGAARGVGAFPLADAAAEAEKTLPSDKGATLAALERIKGKSAAVHLFIEEFLKGGD